jgi:16S rRNA (adenine(1408)-N(1))-methyltransferase
VDLGTGDGRFVLHAARAQPHALVIGVDADAASMVEASRRAARRRDGLPNALFVVAAVERLPVELDGIVDEIRIHFPWGSLLRGIVRGEPAVLGPVARISRDGTVLRVLWSLTDRERGIGLPAFDPVELRHRLDAFGFELEQLREATGAEVADAGSSWAKRLGVGRGRSATRLQARRR